MIDLQKNKAEIGVFNVYMRRSTMKIQMNLLSVTQKLMIRE